MTRSGARDVAATSVKLGLPILAKSFELKFLRRKRAAGICSHHPPSYGSARGHQLPRPLSSFRQGTARYELLLYPDAYAHSASVTNSIAGWLTGSEKLVLRAADLANWVFSFDGVEASVRFI